MTEFKIYHFNWTKTPVVKDLVEQMDSFVEDDFERVSARTEEAAVKKYIKDHGLPSNDSALIGIKQAQCQIFIAKTNSKRTCSVQVVN